MNVYKFDICIYMKINRHMSLDSNTGLDPDGIRIRAATGLEAVNLFFNFKRQLRKKNNDIDILRLFFFVIYFH